MLVISRKRNQSILIGEDIEITITQIEGGNVKIAINAPKEIIIVRKELLEAVKQENLNATAKNLNLLKNIKIKR